MSKRSNVNGRNIYIKAMGWDSIPNGYHVHHKIAVELGGMDVIENLLLVHEDDHKKMHCYRSKNPTDEELELEQELLDFYEILKESKIKPPADNDVIKIGDCQRFTLEHKDELYALKRQGVSNRELVEMFPELGCHATFISNSKILGFDMGLFNDRKNGIINKVFQGENNSFYGKRHTEKSKRKQSEAKKGENNPNYGKPQSSEIKRKQNESRKRTKFLNKLEKNGMNQEQKEYFEVMDMSQLNDFLDELN